MSSDNLSLGKLGEQYTASYLRKLGYEIVQSNVRMNLGEIDIIATKNSVLYIFEVKTRRNTHHGKPFEAVTPNKARRLQIMGEKFALQNNLKDSKLSLGVIAVLIDEDGQVSSIKSYDYFI